MTEANTIKNLLRQAALSLPDSESARLDAEVLMMHVLGKDRAWLFANSDRVPDAEPAERFAGLIQRRASGEPVAYLTGTRSFWTLDLRVTPDVLIPRPETERLVECALEYLEGVSSPVIAEPGTGSGAIALALASERPDARVVATDISDKAVEVARENARRLGIENVEFIQAHWFGHLEEPFDAVISNPPYIDENDPHLARGDCRFEPRQALTPGIDALSAVREICQEAPRRMKPGALLALEHGYDQGPACRELLRKSGFTHVDTLLDLAGLDRVSRGCSS